MDRPGLGIWAKIGQKITMRSSTMNEIVLFKRENDNYILQCNVGH